MTAPGSVRRVPVRVLLWGRTDADLERALGHARWPPSRSLWDFAEQERLTSSACPLDLKEPKALAAEQGYGWAYVVTRVAA